MIVNEIPHHLMLQAARKQYRQICKIRRQGHPAALTYAERVYNGPPSRRAVNCDIIALSILASVRSADLSRGPYYWADEPASEIHGTGPRRMCRGIQLAYDLPTGKYAVHYVPLFSGPARRAA